jgi:hypothetical protein
MPHMPTDPLSALDDPGPPGDASLIQYGTGFDSPSVLYFVSVTLRDVERPCWLPKTTGIRAAEGKSPGR